MQCSEVAIMSRKQLLSVIQSWSGMIKHYHETGEMYPTAVLNDLEHSINAILRQEGVVDDYE